MGILGVFGGKLFYLCFTLVFYLRGGRTRIWGYDAGRIKTDNLMTRKDVTKKERNYEQLYDGGDIRPQEESE